MLAFNAVTYALSILRQKTLSTLEIPGSDTRVSNRTQDRGTFWWICGSQSQDCGTIRGIRDWWRLTVGNVLGTVRIRTTRVISTLLGEGVAGGATATVTWSRKEGGEGGTNRWKNSIGISTGKGRNGCLTCRTNQVKRWGGSDWSLDYAELIRSRVGKDEEATDRWTIPNWSSQGEGMRRGQGGSLQIDQLHQRAAKSVQL